MLKRLFEFLRSVIPADPTQLIFLAGVVSLFLAPHLRWWPTGLGVAPQRVADSFGQTVQSLGFLFVLPITFAAVAGYSVCFWPGNHPIRRILADMLSCDSRNGPDVWSDSVSQRAFLFNSTRYKEPGSQQDQLGVRVAMEVLDRIPFLPDWLAAHSDLHVQAGFRDCGSAVVITWQCCFNSPRFGIMEADATSDLGASGTALFLVQLPRILDCRTSHDFVDASASLQSKYLVLQVFWRPDSHCCFCCHILDRGE